MIWMIIPYHNASWWAAGFLLHMFCNGKGGVAQVRPHGRARPRGSRNPEPRSEAAGPRRAWPGSPCRSHSLGDPRWSETLGWTWKKDDTEVEGWEKAASRSSVSRKEAASPVVIHLIDDQDLVADLLFVEEAVHEGHEDEQLLEAFSEGDDHGQLVRTPGWVVHCRRPSFGPAGRWALLGEELGAVLAWWCHVSWTTKLKPEQRDEQQNRADDEELVDGTSGWEEPARTHQGHVIMSGPITSEPEPESCQSLSGYETLTTAFFLMQSFN